MINRKQGKPEEKHSFEDGLFEAKIDVKINDKVIKEDLDSILYIPTVDKLNVPTICNIMREIPALHARWNFIYNEAVYDYDMKKLKLEIWESNKSKIARNELKKIEEGRVTDKMVEEAKMIDPEYEVLAKDVDKAKRNMKHILAIANGLGEKGDQIVSISSLLKLEIINFERDSKQSKQSYKHIEVEQKQPDPSVNDGWPKD